MKSNRERFEVVAANRVHNLINGFNSLSKCSNKYNYEYNKADVDKMFKELKTALDSCENSFKLNVNTKKDRFKF